MRLILRLWLSGNQGEPIFDERGMHFSTAKFQSTYQACLQMLLVHTIKHHVHCFIQPSNEKMNGCNQKGIFLLQNQYFRGIMPLIAAIAI